MQFFWRIGQPNTNGYIIVHCLYNYKKSTKTRFKISGQNATQHPGFTTEGPTAVENK